MDNQTSDIDVLNERRASVKQKLERASGKSAVGICKSKDPGLYKKYMNARSKYMDLKGKIQSKYGNAGRQAVRSAVSKVASSKNA